MPFQHRQFLSLIVLIAGLLSLVGCGKPNRVPVKGKIMRGPEPLAGGAVCFDPDSSKGNAARVTCMGRVNKSGEYNLSTSAVYGPDSGTGVPPGWYRVTIKTNLPGQTERIDVDPVFTNYDTTPWSVEVIPKPDPGRYDFDLLQK